LPGHGPHQSGNLKASRQQIHLLETPDEAIGMPERAIAQVMNIGDYADVQWLIAQVGDDVFREVLIHAEAGQFNERSLALSSWTIRG
jgi:hypothetical protein